MNETEYNYTVNCPSCSNTIDADADNCYRCGFEFKDDYTVTFDNIISRSYTINKNEKRKTTDIFATISTIHYNTSKAFESFISNNKDISNHIAQAIVNLVFLHDYSNRAVILDILIDALLFKLENEKEKETTN